jgi:hypothetical protein
MLKLPLFGKKKLLLAFEYGLTISQVAKEQGVELTPELVEKAEKIIFNEFKNQTPTRVSVEMIPNILAVFETN